MLSNNQEPQCLFYLCGLYRRCHGYRLKRSVVVEADIDARPSRVAERRLEESKGLATAVEVDKGEQARCTCREAKGRTVKAETLSINLTTCAFVMLYTHPKNAPSAAPLFSYYSAF